MVFNSETSMKFWDMMSDGCGHGFIHRCCDAHLEKTVISQKRWDGHLEILFWRFPHSLNIFTVLANQKLSTSIPEQSHRVK